MVSVLPCIRVVYIGLARPLLQNTLFGSHQNFANACSDLPPVSKYSIENLSMLRSRETKSNLNVETTYFLNNMSIIWSFTDIL